MLLSIEKRAVMIAQCGWLQDSINIALKYEDGGYEVFKVKRDETCYTEGSVTKLLKISDFNSLKELLDTPIKVRTQARGESLYIGHPEKHIWVTLSAL